MTQAKILALGFSSYPIEIQIGNDETIRGRKTDVLADFITRLNAQRSLSGENKVYAYLDWQNVGLSIAHPVDEWQQSFKEASTNAEWIHFNLEGIPPEYGPYKTTTIKEFIIKFGDINFVKDRLGFITAWELGQISRDPVLCNKTTFYESGIIPHSKGSSTWNEICS
ncbi:MAG: hypothetical protein GY796_02160 [Chloroflexi bacterium]|nr:hypothetical protein [Chloroflexota bacterium]